MNKPLLLNIRFLMKEVGVEKTQVCQVEYYKGITRSSVIMPQTTFTNFEINRLIPKLNSRKNSTKLDDKSQLDWIENENIIKDVKLDIVSGKEDKKFSFLGDVILGNLILNVSILGMLYDPRIFIFLIITMPIYLGTLTSECMNNDEASSSGTKKDDNIKIEDSLSESSDEDAFYKRLYENKEYNKEYFIHDIDMNKPLYWADFIKIKKIVVEDHSNFEKGDVDKWVIKMNEKILAGERLTYTKKCLHDHLMVLLMVTLRIHCQKHWRCMQ